MINNEYYVNSQKRHQHKLEQDIKKYSFYNESILFDSILYNEKPLKIYDISTDLSASDDIKLFKLINLNNCVVCNKKVCYLGHCIDHINNIDVNELYNSISAIYYNCETKVIDKFNIKICILNKLYELKQQMNDINDINDITDNGDKNVVNDKITTNDNIDMSRIINFMNANNISIVDDTNDTNNNEASNKKFKLYPIKLEHDILVDLFTNKQITIDKQLINKYKLFFKIIDNELLESHIRDIDINKYFLVDTKIHMCDVMIKLMTIQDKNIKIAIDFNNYPSSLDNINKHRNINKDKYYKDNNFSIIKVDLVNDELTDSIINRVINRILCIIMFDKNINYISDNYKKEHAKVTKLTSIENKKYMDNIKLSIMEKAQLYDSSKNYIYVLKLINNKYYVGRTTNIYKRMKQHTSYHGSFFTKTYKPIDLIEVTYDLYEDDENIKTREVMRLFGHNNVRGGSWCQLELIKPPIL